jgi:molecular chaperone GrpE
MALFKKKMNKEHNEDMDNTSAEEKLAEMERESAENQGDSADPTESTEKVAELQAAVSELKDKHLRLLAEFDNYKKRTMRERLDLLNTASKDAMVALLPVLDDFDRAKKSADDPNNEEVFSEGVTMVYNRLYSILQNMGLKAMTSTGEPFDAELHEAITEIPAPDENMKGKVIDTIEKGYMLHDKIIRHAKVVVGN